MSTSTSAIGETVENGNGGPTADAAATKAKKTPPSEVLPNDRLALDKQFASLRAFAVAYGSNGGKPVTNEAAGSIIGMAGATIVMTNAFLCAVRLLIRQKEEQAFIPSPEALAYNKAYEWDKTTAGEKLRPVFERGWFAEALLPRLKFRAYEEREALGVLAEACNASKDYEPRLEVLLNMMVAAGAVVREGTLIKTPSPRASESSAEPGRQEVKPDRRDKPALDEGHVEFPFVLDPKRNRRVVLYAPHDITKKEFERIRKWMEIQLIVDESNDA